MTTTDPQGSWGTDDSSGFLRHFIGTTKDPYFGTNPKIGDGRALLLHWPVEIEEVTQEGDFSEKIGEEETILFSCGKDWETPDGGETAVHGSGNASKQFHASSAMGMLIDAITGKVQNYGDNAKRTDGDDLEVTLDGAFDVLRERGDATTAATWDGLRWEFAEVAIDYGKDKAGEEIKSVRGLPVKFLGVAGEDKAAAKGKVSKPAAAKKETAKEKAARIKAEKAEAASSSSNGDSNSSSDPFEGLEVSDDLRNQLVELAGGHDSAADFQAAVYDDDDLLSATSDSGVLDVLVDDDQIEGVYEALRA